jgi:hypothetical protein
VDRGVDLPDGEEQVEVADDVVDLRVDGVVAVDHRIGRRPLLAEVHHRLGGEAADRPLEQGRVADVADEGLDGAAAQLVPGRDPVVEVRDRHQARRPQLGVVAAADQVVDDGHLVAAGRQMERRRPPEVAVAAEHQDPHQ